MNLRIPKFIIWAVVLFIVVQCKPRDSFNEVMYESETLEIHRISKNAFVHISYLDTKAYGSVACNGVIYTSGNEAIIFDTPSVDSVAIELIDHVQNKMGKKIKAVVINHFHKDCLGSLQVFHDHYIPSYSSTKTIELARKDSLLYPMLAFDQSHTLYLEGKEIINTFFGEAHTKDNIVSYMADEQVLFGGCMIKRIGAGKGNIADANLNEWSATVQNVKQAYPDVKYVVPGHGQWGNAELLDYTIDLFSVQ